jgi:S1-C subfamily serine protease
MPWRGPGGPAGPGGPECEPGRPHRRGRAVIFTACTVLVLGAGLGMGLALITTPTAPPRAAPSTVPSRATASAPASLSTSAIAAAVDPGLADVTATLGYEDATSMGSGLVVTSSGEVLTNNHVIDGATSVTVTDLGNGRTYTATIAGYDQTADVAVLKLAGASGLKTVTLGTTAEVRVGEPVVALGNAEGKGGTPAVATGAVTGLNQAITATDEAEHTSEQLTGLIQTSVPIQSGDSGGPLVTTGGTVIGMDTAGSSQYQFQSSTTASFAIPVSRVTAVAGQITAGRASAAVHIGPTGFLGIEVALYNVPFSHSTEAVIASAIPGLPAAQAGITAGDVIVSVNGHAVTSPSSLQTHLEPDHPGDKITITWQDPSGQDHTAALILATGPAD